MACHFCDDDYNPMPSDKLEQSDVSGLAEAITSGNLDEALQTLEVLFRDDRRAREWVDIGRRRGERRSRRKSQHSSFPAVAHG